MIRSTGLEQVVMKDARVKAFRMNAASIKKMTSPDPDTTIKEVMSYQTLRVRTSKTLTSSKVLDDVQKTLTHIRLKNQAYRSNIVAKKTDLDVLFSTFNKEYRLVKKYIIAKYGDNFKQAGMTTRTDRDSWVDAQFLDAINIMDRLDVAIEVCEAVIEDIDSQGFAVKDVVNILNIEYKSKYER